MKQQIFTIELHRPIAKDVYEIILSGDTSDIAVPGQFVEITVPGFYLNRPISVCDWDRQTLTLVYKTFGRGTKALSCMQAGQTLSLISGLGNGFSLDKAGQTPLIVGGGVGVPPLYALTRRLLKQGAAPTVCLGFQSREDAFYTAAFAALQVPVLVATMDGSLGAKGTVLDALSGETGFSSYYACGPIPMLKALRKALPIPGQLSLEERMGCGFGACMGCTVQTRLGPQRVCKEGPVFDQEVLLW